MREALARLHPRVREQLVSGLGFRSLRPVQALAIPPLTEGRNALVLAPTAGGKTEAAMLPLLSLAQQERWEPLCVLYLSPLRALLNNQQERMQRLWGLVGRRAATWHGDVSSSRRDGLVREPPDALLTTPESLEVMFVSRRVRAESFLRNVRAVVVDEIHAFAGDDRGAHLAALLERLVELTGRDLQRVGLSATVGDPEALGAWFQGSSARAREVVDPQRGGADAPQIQLDYVKTLENVATVVERGFPRSKRLVFTESRAEAEALGARLVERGVEAKVLHSSLSRVQRGEAEEALANTKEGVVVATSALELGIDIGDLDHVLQVGAPKSVSSFLQRMGRTGRRVGSRSNYTFLTVERADDLGLLQAAALVRLWRRGYVEPVRPSGRAYHVLAHQVLAQALADDGVVADAWWPRVAGAVCFGGIRAADREALVGHMLSEGVLIRVGARLVLGPQGERLYGGKNFLALYGVFESKREVTAFSGGEELGTLDAVFLMQQTPGVTVLALGGRSWRLEEVDWGRGRCTLSPTTELGASVWNGPGVPMGYELCREIRDVLLDGEEDPWWTQRARAQLAFVREQFEGLRAGNDLEERGVGEVRWWTFAGLRANALLGLELAERLGVEQVRWDNLKIVWRSEALSGEQVQRARAELREGGVGEAEAERHVGRAARGRLSKFQPCLPPELELRFLAEQLFDVEAAGWCLGGLRG